MYVCNSHVRRFVGLLSNRKSPTINILGCYVMIVDGGSLLTYSFYQGHESHDGGTITNTTNMLTGLGQETK